MAETVCVGHGGLGEDGNSRCGCTEFSKFGRFGFYDHCVCGASENCHLSPDSKYLTRTTRKSRK